MTTHIKAAERFFRSKIGLGILEEVKESFPKKNWKIQQCLAMQIYAVEVNKYMHYYHKDVPYQHVRGPLLVDKVKTIKPKTLEKYLPLCNKNFK